MNRWVKESLNPIVYSHIYFLEALLSDRIAILFPPNFNTKWILDLNEHNYINKYQTETDPLDDADNNTDQ